PHWIIIAVSSSNAFITLGAFLSIVLVTLIGIGQTPSLIAALLFCSYILCFWGIILGINLAGSVLCVRYRDLNQVWEVATQAGFFIAPVVYPLGILPERFHFYLYLWPPTAVIQFSRMALIEGTLPTSNGHLLLAGMSLTIFAAGVLVYRLFDRTIIEEL
ncbi:MAG: hypothetical protein MUF51_08450, partial [Vicinamibacteria bacterium]|nr:hypothetical protein [Vicinamibacteria bacterium]